MKKLNSLLILIFCLIPFVADAWLLRDEFNTALSAGSVHNTTSEPSGHTRTVTDTENKLSIADGKLTFSGGKASPAWGDPAIWYPSVARAAGVSIILDITPTDATTSAEFGFDSGQSGNIVGNAMRITGDTIITYDGSTAGSSIFIPANATNYQLATILRSAGAYYFLKGGTATKWSMLWAGGADNTTPLYPGIANYDLASTNSFLRVPTTLWLPTPLASDGFGTAGVTDGLGHAEGVAGGIGEGGGGLAWQSGGSTWSVSGGKMLNTPTLGEDIVTNGNMETGDPPTGWSGYSTITVSRGDAHTGDYGIKGVSNTDDSGIVQNLTTVTGTMYKYSMWLKRESGTNSILHGISGVITFPNENIDSTWVNFKASKVAVDTVTPYKSILLGTSGDTTYHMDDVVVKPITLSTTMNTFQTSTPDVIATVSLSAIKVGTQSGVVLNLDSVVNPQNFIVAYHDGLYVRLDKCVNGTWTNVISDISLTYVDKELRVIKDGTTYRLYHNNALIGTSQTISDASIINNTRHGLFSTDAGNTLDNFTLYARGTGGEYNILNQLMSTNTGGSLNLLGVGR